MFLLKITSSNYLKALPRVLFRLCSSTAVSDYMSLLEAWNVQMREKKGRITRFRKFTPGFHATTKHTSLLSFFTFVSRSNPNFPRLQSESMTVLGNTVTVFPPLLVVAFLTLSIRMWTLTSLGLGDWQAPSRGTTDWIFFGCSGTAAMKETEVEPRIFIIFASQVRSDLTF